MVHMCYWTCVIVAFCSLVKCYLAVLIHNLNTLLGYTMTNLEAAAQFLSIRLPVGESNRNGQKPWKEPSVDCYGQPRSGCSRINTGDKRPNTVQWCIEQVAQLTEQVVTPSTASCSIDGTERTQNFIGNCMQLHVTWMFKLSPLIWKSDVKWPAVYARSSPHPTNEFKTQCSNSSSSQGEGHS